MLGRMILNRDNNNSYKALVISLFLIVAWIVVYTTGGSITGFVHLFYIPIILGAWYWYGVGGLGTGTVAGVLTGPGMILDWNNTHSYSLESSLVRFIMFCGIGFVVGKLLNRVVRQRDVLTRSGTSLIQTLAHTIELRDTYTNGHCTRVAEMAVKIGERMGLTRSDLLYLRWAALIHDIGKIAIPETILNKSGKLTDSEYDIMKQHPELGEWALQGSEYGKLVTDGVVSHHERWDGKGYPRGLSGANIPLQGRIIAVPDVWDAITSDRSYRPGLSHSESLSIMREGRGTQFDPEILDIFIDLITTENSP